jgi:hypothetical protein
MIDYERTLVSKDRNKTFLNHRTGEVVPAGTDDVAGRIKRNRDGSFTAYSAVGGSQRVATESAAVHHLIEDYRR